MPDQQPEGPGTPPSGEGAGSTPAKAERSDSAASDAAASDATPLDATPSGVDSNPFASPKALPSKPPEPEPETHRPRPAAWRRALVAVTGVVLTPVAAFIGGFCCCSAIMVAEGGSGMYNLPGDYAVGIGFFGGGAVAGGLAIFAFASWWRSLR